MTFHRYIRSSTIVLTDSRQIVHEFLLVVRALTSSFVQALDTIQQKTTHADKTIFHE